MKIVLVFIFSLLTFQPSIKAQNYDIAKDSNSYVSIQQFFWNSFINNKLSSDSFCTVQICSVTLYLDSTGIIYKYQLSKYTTNYIREFLILTIDNLNNLKVEQKKFMEEYLRKGAIGKPIFLPIVFNLFSGRCTPSVDPISISNVLSLFANSDQQPSKITGEFTGPIVEGIVLNTIMLKSKFIYMR